MLKRGIVCFLVAVICASVAAPAFAAPIPDQLSIQVWPEYNDNQVLLMESVKYPADTPLPIEVKMAIPKGAKVTWAGELLGGDASQDIQATPKITPKDDYDEVAFTLTKARAAQVEAGWSGLTIKDQDRSLTLKWVQRYESKTTEFGLKAPSQSTEVNMSPAPAKQGKSQDGLQGYFTAPQSLAVGQAQDFVVSYKRSVTGPSVSQQPAQQTGAPGGASQPAAGGSDSTVTIIIVGAAVAVVFYAVYAQNQKRKQEEE